MPMAHTTCRLAGLGAQCLVERSDIDQEDWPAIHRWMQQVLSAFRELKLEHRHDYLNLEAAEDTGFGRTRPYMATLTVRWLVQF